MPETAAIGAFDTHTSSTARTLVDFGFGLWALRRRLEKRALRPLFAVCFGATSKMTVGNKP
jgi:hypothetical protein